MRKQTLALSRHSLENGFHEKREQTPDFKLEPMVGIEPTTDGLRNR